MPHLIQNPQNYGMWLPYCFWFQIPRARNPNFTNVLELKD